MRTTNRKYFIFILLGILFFQFIVMGISLSSGARIKHYAEKNNRILSLRCDFTDPYDPVKGRYIFLHFDNTQISKLRENTEWKGLDTSKIYRYYTQENFARYVDNISWSKVKDLDPELEVYVSKNGFCIQKSLTVLDPDQGNKRISIEEYCKSHIVDKK